LAAAAVEREHELSPETLPERALVERCTDGRHQLGVLAEREGRLEALLERVES
jgi:hypothetical protein